MTDQNAIIPVPDVLAAAGQAFNEAAKKGVFEDYLGEKTKNTRRRQKADLDLFSQFLAAAGVQLSGERLQHDAESWRGITWGLVTGFVRWQLKEGYAVSSINIRLSTVKTYAGLAFAAGAIDEQEHSLIRTVKSKRLRAGREIDKDREITRRGKKKVSAVSISDEQAVKLKSQPDTPQGRRDAVLMCLLLDHGLRCGELAILKIGNFDLKAGQLVFYRPKVDKEQTHNLSRDTLAALKAWVNSGDAPLTADAPLLRGSTKGGALSGFMSDRAITKRVAALGKSVDLAGLSAHDCRHYWATKHAKRGVDPFRLQEAGGWSSLAMPRRYVEAAKIANEGMGD